MLSKNDAAFEDMYDTKCLGVFGAVDVEADCNETVDDVVEA